MIIELKHGKLIVDNNYNIIVTLENVSEVESAYNKCIQNYRPNFTAKLRFNKGVTDRTSFRTYRDKEKVEAGKTFPNIQAVHSCINKWYL